MLRLSRSAAAAHYGVAMLSHTDFLSKYGAAPQPASAAAAPASFVDKLLPPLERVETVMGAWKLNRWEHRVPLVMHSEAEKELARRQLHELKRVVLSQRGAREAKRRDVEFLCGALEVKPAELAAKDRKWINEKISKMRWKGEVAAAREVREAWRRLEESALSENNILLRLCCVYGLGRMGTFEAAFSNMILPADGATAANPSLRSSASSSNEVARLDISDPFREVLSLIAAYIPSIDILHDFLGMNTLQGYTPSLATYMLSLLRGRDALVASATEKGGAASFDLGKFTREVRADVQRAAAGKASRILYQNAARGEYLFATSTNSTPLSTTNPFLLSAQPAPIADFVHIVGGDITLLAVAADNHYKREVQLANDKQLEGIARRAVFVLSGSKESAITFDNVRVRSFMLPPKKIDLASLQRLDRVLRLSEPLPAGTQNETRDALTGGSLSQVTETIFPWTAEYTVTTDHNDVDYAAQARNSREDDWKRL